MIGFHQFVKLAIGCLILASFLHIPGVVYAQEKNDLKLDLFDFPVSPNQLFSNEVDNVRESGMLPAVGILPMAAHQTHTHVIVPYMLYNIEDHANVIIQVNPGNGVFTNHETLIKDETENNQVQHTLIRNTALIGDNMELWINACQEGLTNCTSVVIIVTVDGRPPKSIAPTGN
ncbi:MAG: hypothetical protein AAF502_02675 [Bacteroidota bacterium]